MRSNESYFGRFGDPQQPGCFCCGRRWPALLAAVLVLFALSSSPPSVARGQETSSPEAAEAYAKAARAQKNNAYDLAADEWMKFLKDYPKDSLAPRASYYLGVCRLQLKQFAPAATAFRQLLDAAPDHELAEDARLNLGWCLYTLGKDQEPKRLAEAAQRFDELLAKHPDGKYSDQALFFGAESRYAAGEIDQAIPLYRRLLKEHADSRFAADGAYALGVALEEAKRYDEAQPVYESFLAKHADSELVNEVKLRKAETPAAIGASPASGRRLHAIGGDAGIRPGGLRPDAARRLLVERGQGRRGGRSLRGIAREVPSLGLSERSRGGRGPRLLPIATRRPGRKMARPSLGKRKGPGRCALVDSDSLASGKTGGGGTSRQGRTAAGRWR